MKPVRKAVFPVGGLGTRFLPVTKAIPKGMLPIIDRPLIQYAVDEAHEAGIEQLIFVISRGKSAFVEYFDVSAELESFMASRKKSIVSLEPTRIQPGSLVTIRQQMPLGLGHAIWCARQMVGDEPFAVFLPDELMVAQKGQSGCMRQMLEAYDVHGGNVLSVFEVPGSEMSPHGVIIPGASVGAGVTKVAGLADAPGSKAGPNKLIISGRYIFQPQIMEVLGRSCTGIEGEIRLTDAMVEMLGNQPFHAVTFNGRRFDCGSKSGFVEATLAMALQREDLAAEARKMVQRLYNSGGLL